MVKLENILSELKSGNIDVESAKQQILDLLAVDKILSDFCDYAEPIYWSENEITGYRELITTYLKQKPKTVKRVIAVKERSAGNESVGTEWVETKSFSKDTSVEKILDWAGDYKGRLMINWDE